TLPWVTITPLGSEVEPEVNCRYASSSRGRIASQSTPGAGSPTASVGSHGTSASGGPRTIAAARPAIGVVVPTASILPAAAIRTRRATALSLRAPTGGYAGTTTTRAIRQPRNVAT